MTRLGDKNGDGAAQRHLLRRPIVIPLTIVLTIAMMTAGIAYGGGKLADQVIQNGNRIADNTARMERIEKRIEKRLDQLVEMLKWGEE
jgi:predicted PurR-regulated permease PerM